VTRDRDALTAEIHRMRERGATWPEVAAAFCLDKRTAQKLASDRAGEVDMSRLEISRMRPHGPRRAGQTLPWEGTE